MAQLIDKDALVAEIEKRIVEYKDMKIDGSYYEGMVASLEFFRDEFLDILEVKDVDLEEKATQLSQKYFPDEENIWARPNIEAQKCKSACIEMVEWFKAQKGEDI